MPPLGFETTNLAGKLPQTVQPLGPAVTIYKAIKYSFLITADIILKEYYEFSQ
jgi:hypothetical protein